MFGPDFALPRDVIETAFNSVTAGLTVGTDIRDDILRCYSAAYLTGNPREEKKCFEDRLLDREWSWLELEKFYRIFQKRGWPDMWRGPISDGPPNAPASIPDALPFLTAKELRHWLKTNGIYPKPAPRNRSAVEEFIGAYKDPTAFRPLLLVAHHKYKSKVADYERKRKKQVCGLLAHTISFKAFSLRNLREGIARMEKRSGKYRWVAESGGGDEIEAAFSAEFNAREHSQDSLNIDTIPPLFPGHRCTLRLHSDRVLKRRKVPGP